MLASTTFYRSTIWTIAVMLILCVAARQAQTAPVCVNATGGTAAAVNTQGQECDTFKYCDPNYLCGAVATNCPLVGMLDRRRTEDRWELGTCQAQNHRSCTTCPANYQWSCAKIKGFGSLDAGGNCADECPTSFVYLFGGGCSS